MKGQAMKIDWASPRKLKGLTQQGAADDSGVLRYRIAMIERGYEPRVHEIRALCKLYNLDVKTVMKELGK